MKPTGLRYWSGAAVTVLERLKLSAQLRFVLDRLVAELKYLSGEMRSATQAAAARWRFERSIKIQGRRTKKN